METTTVIGRKYDQLFIGGEWINPSTDHKVDIVSPHDQSITGYTVLAEQADIDLAVAAARKAFDQGPWPKTTPEERQALITKFNEIHSTHTAELAALTTAENGSPIWFTGMLQQALAEQTNAYLRAAKAFEWESTQPAASGGTNVIRREPVGVVAAIIPWNAPQQSALVKIIPALLAGCTVVFKPTPETSLDGIALGELFKQAGLPDGVLSIVPAGREVSEYLVSHAGVDKIAFTGSTRAGQQIASIAGKQMKRYSLELGGKSAAIILEDADIAMTAGMLKYYSFGNNGQACVGQTRILAPKSRYAEISEALTAMVASIPVGDPNNMETFQGPIFNKAQYDRVNSYLELGVQEGATITTGGLGKPEGAQYEKGWYIKPTVFTNANNEMRIAREEIFGPVIVIIPYETEADAIRIANDSPYGLAGSVWTSNKEKGLEIAKQIRTGTFSINGAATDFNSPFGGYKQSGVGREFGGAGLAAFTETKAIAM
ncbi:aldehyde dehydrogenase [Pedobacter sp. L105]|uniref:aldehyde dehydrogenase n=1 Tax=Pedobacter sp. L105 TaxID=1641871 RepID=UPI00131C5EDD|nr:aldehyde dehydrogenase [Pedobacter sp. L105]